MIDFSKKGRKGKRVDTCKEQSSLTCQRTFGSLCKGKTVGFTLMKGISLPINMVAVVAVLILVLVSVSFFFASSSTQFGSELEAKTYFVSTCPQLRCGYETSAQLKDSYQKFYDACKFVLGPQAEEKPYQCLQQCGCSAEVSDEEVQENINEFVALLKK